MAIVISGRTLRSYLTRVTIGTRSISATGTTSTIGIRGFLSRLGGFVFGLITIKLFLHLISKVKLLPFAIYRIILVIIIAILYFGFGIGHHITSA